MKTSGLVLGGVIVMLASIGLMNTADAQCPNIEGVWSSPGPNGYASENIRQSGCDFLATLPASYFNHAVSGKFLGSSNYSLTIVRTNKPMDVPL
jgi:hypothetical protein